MSFVEELKRRNVIKVAVAYVVVAWLVMQFSDVILNNIEAPDWVFQVIMLVLGIGFALALFFAWAFEMTPDGIKREHEVDRSQSITQKTGRKLDFLIIGVMAVALVYFVWESRFSAPIAPATSKPADISRDNSIAVLPFANRSMQQEDQFFTDGIHDDLLTQLAKIGDLTVISRTSMMKYRDTEKSIPEIGAELGVSTILEGGIQRAGKRIRINAQLIDVKNDQHIWAETFDREMTIENIFDIQSEITRQIVSAVRGELTDAETATLAQIPTKNLEAYEAYLQALALIGLPDYVQDNYIEAETWLKKALELDPEYAHAWAMQVVIHGQAIWIGYDSSPERFAAAKEAVENARILGPGSSETLAAEGEYLYRIENNYAASVGKFQAAHELAPGNADILERLAVAQRRAGLFDDAIANFKKVMATDPENSRTATLLTNTITTIGRFEEATPLVDQWMRKFPDARDLRAQRIGIYMYGDGDLVSARALYDSLAPWPGNEFFVVATELPMMERNYQGVIDAYEIPEIVELLQNRGYMGGDGWPAGFAQRMLGNEDAAVARFDAAIGLIANAARSGTNTDGFEFSFQAPALASRGRFDEAIAAADRAVEIMQSTGDAIFTPDVRLIRALVLGMAGKREESLAELEDLFEQGIDISRWQLYLDPNWDFFRDDERFNELVRPLNLKAARQ
jgi:TolB-like protein/Flp pilus assembly protein TadD